jgi:5,5'-dehydrodivanillate O-demethylase
MLTEQENVDLTRVGPGTPAGELLRRYWYPVAATIELTSNPVKPVRLLGEDLALFRDRSGRLGLVADRCAHRLVALSYGMVEPNGLRCMYHGWVFDSDGNCIEQPNEAPGSRFKEACSITAYPVEELGGLIWAYLGPEPAPLLPRWDLFVEEGRYVRQITECTIPCNWLQIMENSVDPVHTEWAHGNYAHYVLAQMGLIPEPKGRSPHHSRIGFDEFEYGIIKRRVYEGRTEEHPDWAVGHPLVFPDMLRNHHYFQIRVPVDDTHTWHIWYHSTLAPEDVEVPDQSAGVPMVRFDYLDDNGRVRVDNVNGQDIAAWLTQGDITDRTEEKLGSTDLGIQMFRKMLKREIANVARGEDPIGIIRDPTKNECILLPDQDVFIWQSQGKMDSQEDLKKEGVELRNIAGVSRNFSPDGWKAEESVAKVLEKIGNDRVIGRVVGPQY